MFAIGTIRDEIASQKELKAQMEAMLKTHILPEFNSAQPMMRSRACWTYSVWGGHKF
jgi:hypothetical protein